MALSSRRVRRTILIDADIVAFAHTAANEKTFYFDGRDGPACKDADFESAKEGAVACIEEYREMLGADDVVVCLSDPDANFRKDIWPSYKSNRNYDNRPIYLQALKDWFKERFKTYQRPGLEADDCMGILATHPTLIKGQKIIVSEDKDMQTIPGLLLNPRKDEKPRRIGALQADLFHLWQTIVGDACDGYPGAKGVGEKSKEAQAVLTSRSVVEAWGHVVAAYERKGFQEEDAVIQARLARILRASDWNFKEKRPILWEPPKVRK